MPSTVSHPAWRWSGWRRYRFHGSWPSTTVGLTRRITSHDRGALGRAALELAVDEAEEVHRCAHPARRRQRARFVLAARRRARRGRRPRPSALRPVGEDQQVHRGAASRPTSPASRRSRTRCRRDARRSPSATSRNRQVAALEPSLTGTQRVSSARSAGTSTSKPSAASRTTRTARPAARAAADVSPEGAGAVGERERRCGPGPRAPGSRRRGGTARRSTIGRSSSVANRSSAPAGARGRSAWATTARTKPWSAHQATPAAAARSRSPGSSSTVDAGGRRPTPRTSSADDTTTTGSVPAAATHPVGHPLAPARHGGAASSVSERRALPTANARIGITTPARASRDGSGTMSLRMLPTVDATYVLARSALFPPLQLGIQWTIEGAQMIPVRGPVILASNHVSYLDPLVLAYLADRRHRKVRFLAKAELFEKGVLGPLLRAARPDPGAARERGRGLVARRRGRRAAVEASASPCSPRARSRSTSTRWRGSPAPRGSRSRAACPSRRSGSGGRTAIMFKGRKPSWRTGVAETVVVGPPLPIAPDEDVLRGHRPDHGGDLRAGRPGPGDLPAAPRARRRRLVGPPAGRPHGSAAASPAE